MIWKVIGGALLAATAVAEGVFIYGLYGLYQCCAGSYVGMFGG